MLTGAVLIVIKSRPKSIQDDVSSEPLINIIKREKLQQLSTQNTQSVPKRSDQKCEVITTDQK